MNSGYMSGLSSDEQVMMSVVRVAERFKKESSAIFKQHGLTFSQYNVLRVLDSSRKGQNTITKVSRIMLVSGANLTGIAKRLEKNGFLIRQSDPRDERLTVLRITPKGKQTIKGISGEKEKNLKKYLSGYTDAEKQDLLNILKGILAESP